MRPIENLDFPGPVPEPERLILDGQQRLTTLTQVLALDKPVKTFDEKGGQIDRLLLHRHRPGARKRQRP